eukprot:16408742-Heterocapsa_arctica.AAC.1
MALKVVEGFGRFPKGVQASSLSPLDSSQNAGNCAQHLSLRANIEPRTNSLFVSYLFVLSILVMYTCACTPVGPPQYRQV